MCGIAGYWTRGKVDSALLGRMGGSIIHRGPDDGGEWADPATGIGFANRRLAIVDLSPAGHQPMESADGRWALTFNGEIYNHRELRAELDQAGHRPEGGWRGHSDTETLIEAIAAWGLEAALQRSAGMFAFALWDRKERRLLLARDRFGERPLYYGRAGRDFVFASELKAIRCHPDFVAEIDRDALAAFASLTVIPAPMSIYKGIAKLPPGTILSLDAPDGEPAIAPYWSYRDVVLAGLADPVVREEEALELLDSALRAALAGQSVADVAVGAFLSGGIDSSAVVAFYQSVSGQPVKTYSIGFDEAGYDESAAASRVARHLGTDHHEHRVGVAEAQAAIPLLPTIYDEPFADSSQIPTYIVSRFARQDVTVAISGDGGDELFAGYNRHRVTPQLWRRISALPRPMRKGAAMIPAGAWNLLARFSGEHRAELGGKAAKAARIMSKASSLDDVHDSFVDEWFGHASPVRGGSPPQRSRDLPDHVPDIMRLTYADTMTYLPDDILAKVDRAAMAVSLETRVPFLDHRVAAVAARIDPALKVHGGKGKQILRTLLHQHVPPALVDRPKAGFSVPVGDWIKGPLRDWAESLLDPRRLAADGYFDVGAVRGRWDGHLAGRSATAAIWAVLMFQAWLDAQHDETALPATRALG